MVFKMIEYIIIFLSFMDLLLSYLYLKQFIKMFPKTNYIILEANPFIKLSLKLFGFPIGMFVSIPFVIGMWILIVNLLEYQWLYFAMGTLSMMLIYHYVNYNQLKVLEKNPKIIQKKKRRK